MNIFVPKSERIGFGSLVNSNISISGIVGTVRPGFLGRRKGRGRAEEGWKRGGGGWREGRIFGAEEGWREARIFGAEE
jgi:hypothetical protein